MECVDKQAKIISIYIYASPTWFTTLNTIRTWFKILAEVYHVVSKVMKTEQDL